MKTAELSDREIIMTKLIGAPRDLVFEAYTEERHVKHWYGPNGFTITTHEMNVKPGGLWRFMMHGPDGTDYPNRIKYIEVIKPERLVFEHSDDGEPPVRLFHVSITFSEAGAKTLVTSRMLFPTKAERDQVIGFGAIELGQQTFSRLAEYVTGMGKTQS